MASRLPFSIGEWYHCFNRGVDKRLIFETQRDYERFLLYMYIANGTNNIRASNFSTKNIEMVFADDRIDRGEPLVEIGAYALMPNHFHFILREIRENGTAAFMQKLCTGYTMYFNNSRERTGSLLAGTFKSSHIADDDYLKRVVAYVLLNPVELFEPRWKEGIGDIQRLTQIVCTYRYSSLPDFMGEKRPLEALLGGNLSEYYEKRSSIEELLREAKLYFLELQV